MEQQNLSNSTIVYKNKMPFHILLLIKNGPNKPRVLMEKRQYQEVILTFKSSYLRNTFCKTITAIDSDSFDGSRQSKLKTFCKEFTIQNAIRNMIQHLSGKKVIADAGETARELEVEHKEVGSTLGEHAVNIVEMTTKVLEHFINLVNKAVAGFGKTDFNFKRSFPVGKMLSNSITCYREIFCERNSQLMWQTSLLSSFQKLPQPFQLSATITLVSHKTSVCKQDLPPAKRLTLTFIENAHVERKEESSYKPEPNALSPPRLKCKTRFHCIIQAGLELLGSSNLPASISQCARMTAVSHCARSQDAHFIEAHNPSTSASWVGRTKAHATTPSYSYFVKTRSFYVTQAGLKLLTSRDPLTLPSQ
ncbi:Tigger transposable element-derived protein 1, partial [Plecturocebus cupreus]